MKRAAADKRPPLKLALAARRTQFIVVGVVIVVSAVLATYVWYSVQKWSEVATHTHQTNGDVKARILKLEDEKRSSSQVRAEAAAISDEIEGMCQITGIVSWQKQLAPGARDALESCATYQKTLSQARDALNVFISRVTSEQQFAKILAAQKQHIAATGDKSVKDQRAAWQQFAVEVKKVKVHESLKSAQKSAQTTANEIVAAYDALEKANKEEDRAAYDKAIAGIEKGYSKLGEMQNLAVESYSRLVDDVHGAAQEL